MKRSFRCLLCGLLAALSLSTAAFAAGPDLLISPAPTVPERQGDFYVLVNGEYVTFPDAVPRAKDNRSFLPMAAVFSQLGFAQEDMTWNTDGIITATKHNVTYTPFNGGEAQQGDMVVTLTLGSNVLTIHYPGDMTVSGTGVLCQVYYDYAMDVAPYVDPATWRTYVPFGLVADALGYKVGWDGTTGTVIIDDVDAILAANTETYELMDQYTAYTHKITGEKSQVSGSYSMGMVLGSWTGDELTDVTFLMDGSYQMSLASAGTLELETAMNLSCTETVNGEDVTQARIDSGEREVLPDKLDLALRGDLAQGAFYIRSGELCKLLDQSNAADTWFKLDFAGLLAGSGLDYASLIESALQQNTDTGFADALKLMLQSAPLTSAEMTTRDYLDLYNAILADSSFVETENGYVNDMSSAMGTPMALTLLTENGKVSGYIMELYSLDPAAGNFGLITGMNGSEMIFTMNLDTSAAADLSAPEGEYLIVSMGMDGDYSSTSLTPKSEPPAGANVVDLLSLLEELDAESPAEL